MKVLAVASLALAAVSSVAADTPVVDIRCNTTVIKPWILSTQEPAKSCFDATGFKASGFPLPTQESAATFCQAPACRTMLDTVVSVKPATGDCWVLQTGTPAHLNFYETIISVFVDTCKKVLPPTPAPTSPEPTTPMPTTPAPTTPAPTTPEPIKPVPTKPVPTTSEPITKPVPTTARPQC